MEIQAINTVKKRPNPSKTLSALFRGDMQRTPTAIATDNAGNSSEFSACEQVVACTPPAAVTPSIAAVDNDVQLSWSSSSPGFDVFRSTNEPYFSDPSVHATTGTTSWTNTGAAGDVANNQYYYVRSVAGCSSAPSQTVGEFDFALVPGN